MSAASSKFELLVDHVRESGRRVRSFRHQRCQLGVVLAPDPSSPVISYQTWYDVGSANESPGKTGLAHFFEHLMFTSTTNRGLGEFDRLIESIGGDTNAATWLDWTYYRDSVPAGELELCVALESDRMVNLDLSHDTVESEREVIINERRERVDDDVDGFLDERLMQLAFGANDPYGWPTIGWMEDIEKLTLDDLRGFYRQHYAPRSATIVVVGGFEEDQALELLDRHYGDLITGDGTDRQFHPTPRPPPLAGKGESSFHPTPRPPPLAGKGESYSRPISSERGLYAWPVPGQNAREWAVLDLVAQLLAGSPSARLYRELVVERQLATSVTCAVLPLRRRSIFELSLHASARAELSECEEVARRALDSLASEGVSAEEMDKVKAGMLTDFWTDLTSPDGIAEALGHHQLVCGSFERLFEIPRVVDSITAQEVQHAVRSLLPPSREAVVRVRPSP